MSETTKKKFRIRRGHAAPEIVQRKEMNESIITYMEKATEMIDKISAPAAGIGVFTPPAPPSITPEERVEFNDLWAKQQVFEWLLQSGRYDWHEALAAADEVIAKTRIGRERVNELQKKMGGYSRAIAVPVQG